MGNQGNLSTENSPFTCVEIPQRHIFIYGEPNEIARQEANSIGIQGVEKKRRMTFEGKSSCFFTFRQPLPSSPTGQRCSRICKACFTVRKCQWTEFMLLYHRRKQWSMRYKRNFAPLLIWEWGGRSTERHCGILKYFVTDSVQVVDISIQVVDLVLA